MKRTPAGRSNLASLALACAGMLGAIAPAHAGLLTIATDPLGTAPTSVQPNLMFILDDSASMLSDYMPEIVFESPTSLIPGTAACADAGDEGIDLLPGPLGTLGRIDNEANRCEFGDPPYNSPDFNQIYYNPGLRYLPGVKFDGASFPSQNRINTTNWTLVPDDGYKAGGVANLLAGYPDRVWCKEQDDDPADCVRNSSYQFPDFQFPFGRLERVIPSPLGFVKRVGGAPYYYRMQTAQYCTDAARTTCVSGSAVNPGPIGITHLFQAPEYCKDPELTDCAAGAAVTSLHTFSGPRWCSDAGTLSLCQRKKIAPFVYPKHLGTTTTQDCTPPNDTLPGCNGSANSGTIRITSVHPDGGTISNIKIGGVDVFVGTIAIAAGTSPTDVATAIAATAFPTPDYTATSAGPLVTITSVTPGAAGAGNAIALIGSQIGVVGATGRIGVGRSANGTAITAADFTVNGAGLFCTAGALPADFGNDVTVGADGKITAALGFNTDPKRISLRDAILSRINACSGVNGGYTGTPSDSGGSNPVFFVDLLAPVSLGETANSFPTAKVLELRADARLTIGALSGGVSDFAISNATTAMSGGQPAFTSTRTLRIGVGAFSRTDIVSTNDAYPKTKARTDCAGAFCTFEEEMTNFANWFTYYRTRLLMTQSSLGRGFLPIDAGYRVGLITINPGSPVRTEKYLPIREFDPAHRSAWYEKLYAMNTEGETPLREALSRVGQLYAGTLDTGLTSGIPVADDPVIAACQPSFAILSTDGYWTGGVGEGKDKDGGAIGNADGVDDGFSKREIGAFDALGATGSLADVAMYYYMTDLRPSLTNLVRPTAKDTAVHQHMVTFTIGLGLEGELRYDPNYEKATSGDFFDIRLGTKNWPVPSQNTPSTLDDLWHAAVNGRGVFFSAKDSDQLAAGLSTVLAQLQVLTGAGAAAATSNLQPVAGDNFAFTAQYKTGEWTGDLSARTIDLTNGNVSSVILWTARDFLNTRPYTERPIYTFDPTDPPTASPPVPAPLVTGPAGNRLKHFCWPGTGGATCTDGSGLDAAEQALFNPALQLPQATVAFPLTPWTPAQTANATGPSLVDYLRGENALESSGLLPALSSDLYRPRPSLLGDLVNAQPAYVKKSPFLYNTAADKGYQAFKSCTEGTGAGCLAALFPDPSKPRRGTVYAAANDGMLHAFETDFTNTPGSAYFQTAGISSTDPLDDVFTGTNFNNGVERWTYIPRLLMPKLYRLASIPYIHTYYADGSPQVGDICVSVTGTPPECQGQDFWRTILVAGFNSGGNGYYALDITNPDQPKGLWEFGNAGVCYSDVEIAAGDKTSDCNVGLSYGNPVISKRKSDGKWVVLVTSGYNNNAGGATPADRGDGKGYLYVLDAATGVILHRISTGAGTAASPSGLAKINAFTTNGLLDNTALAVYGGDLEGNVWRFQLDNTAGGFLTATKVAVAKDASGNPQPITVKPELGEVFGERIIVFGTGKFLESADPTPPAPPATFQTQTIYALRDNLSVTSAGPVIPNVRDATAVPVRTFGAGAVAETRTVVAVATAPNLAVDAGWLIDLPDNGERVNVDPILQLGTLIVASNVPTSGSSCLAGGYGYLNFLDLNTGAFVPGATGSIASVKIASSIIVGISVVMLPDGKVKTITTLADDTRRTEDTPTPPTTFIGRRVSWRELFAE